MNITYSNETEFRKMERSLRRYNMLAYKKLLFEYYPELRNGKKIGKKIDKNKYVIDLYTDRIFEQAYEKIRVSYKIENDNIVLIDISPKELWLYEGELTIYKGCPVKRDDIKTRFKLDLLHRVSGK